MLTNITMMPKINKLNSDLLSNLTGGRFEIRFSCHRSSRCPRQERPWRCGKFASLLVALRLVSARLYPPPLDWPLKRPPTQTKNSRRGIACVEFAVVAPVLVIITFSIVDICNVMHLKQKLKINPKQLKFLQNICKVWRNNCKTLSAHLINLCSLVFIKIQEET